MTDEKPEANNTGKNTGNGNLRPPWKPGQVTNPKGRPRGSVSLTSILKKTLKEVATKEGHTYAEVLVRATVQNAVKGNGQALKLCWDRIDGILQPAEPDTEAAVTKVGELLKRITIEAKSDVTTES